MEFTEYNRHSASSDDEAVMAAFLKSHAAPAPANSADNIENPSATQAASFNSMELSDYDHSVGYEADATWPEPEMDNGRFDEGDQCGPCNNN
eukprot:6213782-Pleurochrysis_carterae.AAC.3